MNDDGEVYIAALKAKNAVKNVNLRGESFLTVKINIWHKDQQVVFQMWKTEQPKFSLEVDKSLMQIAKHGMGDEVRR